MHSINIPHYWYGNTAHFIWQSLNTKWVGVTQIGHPLFMLLGM